MKKILLLLFCFVLIHEGATTFQTGGECSDFAKWGGMIIKKD